MADGTKIGWTDATWNVLTGCDPVTPGCTDCYAMRLAGGRLRNHPSRAGLTIPTKTGPVWNGVVKFNRDWLLQPLGWCKPRRIFAVAHGDMFHISVTDDVLDQIWLVMALCPHHQFQVLTKRSDRMREYLTRIAEESHTETQMRFARAYLALPLGARKTRLTQITFPLPNVWVGVSVEDQKRADERVPDLLHTPAAVRWVSAEPLLEAVNFEFLRWPRKRWLDNRHRHGYDAFKGARFIGGDIVEQLPKLDWIVTGGLSGRGTRRPCHPTWVRDIQRQCAKSGTAFNHKQWGEWQPVSEMTQERIRELADDGNEMLTIHIDGRAEVGFGFPKMPMDFYRVGNRNSGRLLGGRIYDEYPQTPERPTDNDRR